MQELIYELMILNKLGFIFWIEQDQLQYLQFKQYRERDKVIAWAKSNKDKLKNLLKLNIFNYDFTPYPYIYKYNTYKYPLSFAQERLWFIEKYEQGTNAYNIPMVFKLASNTVLSVLTKAIDSIVKRHEVLRTLIRTDNDGNSYQFISDLQIKYIEEIEINDSDELKKNLEQDYNQIFDLSNEYPIKVKIYKLENTSDNYLSIVIHHIAFDGWSTDILLEELEEYYSYYDTGLSKTTKINLPELTIQYKDFALWQRSYLTGEVLDKQLNYWKYKLDDYETLNLIPDKVRSRTINNRGADVYFEINENISSALRKLAKEFGISIYSVLLAAYFLMLRSYTNQDNIVIGTPVANRHFIQIENLIGFFVNILALRTNINAKSFLKNYIQEIGKEVTAAQEHQDLPFEKLVEELRVARDTSRHPIFQVMFIVQGFGSKFCNNKSHFLREPYEGLEDKHNTAKFDLSTFIDDSSAVLRGRFNYAVNLYKKQTIINFITTYNHILKQIANMAGNKLMQEEIRIEGLNYLNQDQYNQVIYNWNATECNYPKDKTIHQLFEEQVVKTPDSIALVYEHVKLTYKELNQKANRLAHYLKNNYQIKPEDLIVLCLDRNEHMLVTILAVLKAGGVYVPIDPLYPQDRFNYILEDSKSKLILINQKYEQKIKQIVPHTTKITIVDSSSTQKELASCQIDNLETKVTSMNLAYVIYTSGTTGKAKGVMVCHRGIVNRIQWMNSKYPLTIEDKILQKTPYVFDVSVWEFFWPHLYGASIVVAKPEGHKDPIYLINLIKEAEITITHFVPSMLIAFINHLEAKSDKNNLLPALKRIFCSGEELSLPAVQNCYKLLPHIEIHNLYGPTEASIDVLYYDCHKSAEQICIGKPIDNTKIYILSNTLNPLPIGAIGELYIGGVGLASGYLNQQELTFERFIDNPFQTEEEKQDKSYGLKGRNARLYKTGDLARWLPDGNIAYIGRNDFQVKIRGYRIELGEIENVLVSYEGVKAAVVLACEGLTQEHKYLVGYYVAANKLDEEHLLHYLSSKLPEYMVPTALVCLEQLPLTANGKLDRKALPKAKLTTSEVYVAPSNELESKICQIWAKVLGVNTVNKHDNFFDLGGNSLLLNSVYTQLPQKIKEKVTIMHFFQYTTVAKLATFISKQLNTKKNDYD